MDYCVAAGCHIGQDIRRCRHTSTILQIVLKISHTVTFLQQLLQLSEEHIRMALPIIQKSDPFTLQAFQSRRQGVGNWNILRRWMYQPMTPPGQESAVAAASGRPGWGWHIHSWT